MEKKHLSSIVRYLVIIVLGLSACDNKIPDRVPTGEWKYKLLINGSPAGSSRYSNRVVGDTYVSTVDFTMSMAGTETVSRSVITESLRFEPIRLESKNTLIKDGSKHNTDTVVVFAGRKATVAINGVKSSYVIPGDFILEGNYIVAKLIEGKFKEGFEITASIYDPNIELDVPVPIRVKVIGHERVKVGRETRRLMHITESIENVKNIDVYLDENGGMVKTVIQMMNMTIEMVLE